MLTTRQVFNYTLHGRDIFDDLEELDRQEALRELDRENNIGYLMAEIMMTLDAIGIDMDTVDFGTLMAPTQPKKDDNDFIMAPINPVLRTGKKTPNYAVKRTMLEFMISGHFNDEMLLNAPYDVAVALFNDFVKEQNKRNRKR